MPSITTVNVGKFLFINPIHNKLINKPCKNSLKKNCPQESDAQNLY